MAQESENASAAPKYSPSNFMRARRPERFSDSVITPTAAFDADYFEFILDKITTDKRQFQFENLCRRLAEKEIAPNLIPTTGPVGGGDSKRDSETYPVSDEIADAWWVSEAREAAKGKWAFAMSAKAKWKPKIKGDVDKIVKLDREFERIYFMTNQPVKDKDRAKVEDELGAEYNVDVRILDRTWITEKVTQNGHQRLAAATLDYRLPFDDERTLGPKDASRTAELNTLNEDFKNKDRYIGGGQAYLIEDLIYAGELARGLELPLAQTEKYFLQARRIARRIKNSKQLLRASYAHAWTLFHWYDEVDEAWEILPDVEEPALASEYTADLERLSTLLTVFLTAARSERFNVDLSEVESKLNNLIARLQTLCGLIWSLVVFLWL